MDTKLSQLKKLAAAGNWTGALRIAAKFPQLGVERSAILDAHMAITNPRFFVQLKRCPNKALEQGIFALCNKYNIQLPS